MINKNKFFVLIGGASVAMLIIGLLVGFFIGLISIPPKKIVVNKQTKIIETTKKEDTKIPNSFTSFKIEAIIFTKSNQNEDYARKQIDELSRLILKVPSVKSIEIKSVCGSDDDKNFHVLNY
jgi:hypothetical protein